ncbi:MAG: hypothetical protein RIT43_2462 [Bacteroidota bacterium]
MNRYVEYLCYMMFRLWHAQLIIVFCLTGCSPEEARGPLHPEVRIASDCLYPKDTVLFENFIKTTGISVRIRHTSADRILSDLRKDNLLAHHDLIVLKGTSAIQQSEASALFMSIPADSLPKELRKNHISKHRKIIGVGFDPYIIVTYFSSVSIRPNYASLYDSSGWCSDLSETPEWQPYADFLKSSSTLRISNPKLNCIKILREKDTLRYADVLFTKYSNFQKKKKTLLKNFSKGALYFPNQTKGGYAYDMPAAMIVNQAYNYTNALMLLRYLCTEQGNVSLNRVLRTLPLHSGKKLKRSKISPIQRIK